MKSKMLIATLLGCLIWQQGVLSQTDTTATDTNQSIGTSTINPPVAPAVATNEAPSAAATNEAAATEAPAAATPPAEPATAATEAPAAATPPAAPAATVTETTTTVTPPAAPAAPATEAAPAAATPPAAPAATITETTTTVTPPPAPAAPATEAPAAAAPPAAPAATVTETTTTVTPPAVPAATTNEAPAAISNETAGASAVTSPVAPAATTNASPSAATSATPASASASIPLIQFQDVPITTAIENLTRQAGINYLLDPKIGYGQPDQNGQVKPEPTLSIRWENITASQALVALLDNYGLQLVEDRRTHIARITTKDPTAPPPLSTRVVQLKYASTSNLVESIQASLTDKRSKILPDSRTSQLVVVATENEQEAVETLVNQLDKPTRQVLIGPARCRRNTSPLATAT